MNNNEGNEINDKIKIENDKIEKTLSLKKPSINVGYHGENKINESTRNDVVIKYFERITRD